MNTICDLKDPRISSFLSLKDHQLEKDNLILIDSYKCIVKFIQCGFSILKIFGSSEEINRIKPHLNGHEEIFLADPQTIKSIVGFKFHKGLMALGKRPSLSNLSNLEDSAVYVNGVTSPENIGSIVRTMLGLGFNNFIYDGKSASPLLRRAIRVSTGNVFKLNVFNSSNISDLALLKERGFQLLGAANMDGAKFIQEFSFPSKSILMIGSEGHGLDAEHIKVCNHILKIPVDNFVEHYNASVAAALILYQWRAKLGF